MYCDFEEYVKNRKPDKLSLKNLVDPSLEKPYDKDECRKLQCIPFFQLSGIGGSGNPY